MRCASEKAAQCFAPRNGKKRTACARCIQKRTSCIWPGQPEKPPRKSRVRDGTSTQRRRGRKETDEEEDEEDEEDELEETPRIARPRPRPKARNTGPTASAPVAPVPRKRTRQDYEDGHSAPAPEERFLDTGISWSLHPDDGLTLTEVVNEACVELQLLRRRLRKQRQRDLNMARTLRSLHRIVRADLEHVRGALDGVDMVFDLMEKYAEDTEPEDNE